MDAQDMILDDITWKQLIWHGHVDRMDPTRLPKIMIHWKPEGGKKRRRPRRTWKDGIYTAMNGRDLRMGEWNNRRQWNMKVEGKVKRQNHVTAFLTSTSDEAGLIVCCRHDRHCQVSSMKKELPFIHYQFSIEISDSIAKLCVTTAVLLNVQSVLGMLRCVVG